MQGAGQVEEERDELPAQEIDCCRAKCSANEHKQGLGGGPVGQFDPSSRLPHREIVEKDIQNNQHHEHKPERTVLNVKAPGRVMWEAIEHDRQNRGGSYDEKAKNGRTKPALSSIEPIKQFSKKSKPKEF